MIEWSELKKYASIDDAQKELATFALAGVVSFAERIAGRALASRDLEQVIYVYKGDMLFLQSYPISNVSDAVNVKDNTTSVKTYLIDAQMGKVGLEYEVTGYYAIKYKGGYVDAPADLKLAIVECVSLAVRRLATSTVGVSMLKLQSGTEQVLEQGYPYSARQIFESYRSCG